MLTDYEIGWYRYQTKFDGSFYFFRVYRIGAVQMGWVNLNSSDIEIIKNDKVMFKSGLFTYIITFTNYEVGLEKTHFVAKLFNLIPFYSYKGVIGVTNKSKLLNVFAKCS